MTRPALPALFLGIAAVAVVAAVAGGIWVMGSPATQRLLRLDEHRVRDLRAISEAVNRYWENNEQLPDDLKSLSDGTPLGLTIQDPATGEAYRYVAGNGQSYQLCADFSLDSERDAYLSGTWSHRAGPYCFDLDTCACKRPLLR